MTIVLAVAAAALAACRSGGDGRPVAPDAPPRILIAGDSTASDYPRSRAPQSGWGQALPYFVSEDVHVLNFARSGRSTRSFVDEGWWAKLIDAARPGDLVLISFGHNDARRRRKDLYAAPMTAYKANLEALVAQAREAGAQPVVLSPVARRAWRREGEMRETLGSYRAAARLASEASGADFIDLSQLSVAYFEPIGRQETKRDYIWGEMPNWRTGEMETVRDNTHFSFLGACGVARLVAGALAEQSGLDAQIELGEDAPGTDARPAAVTACAAQLEAQADGRG